SASQLQRRGKASVASPNDDCVVHKRSPRISGPAARADPQPALSDALLQPNAQHPAAAHSAVRCIMLLCGADLLTDLTACLSHPVSLASNMRIATIHLKNRFCGEFVLHQGDVGH